MRLKAIVIAVQQACLIIGLEWRRKNPEKANV